MAKTHEFAQAFEIPFEPDPVAPASIMYGQGPAAIVYPTSDDEFVRVSFENLDALKVCRGESLPFESVGQQRGACYIVENSHWLSERHAYEAKHYRGRYEFGNDEDQMLTLFDHYLLSFHDEFVEAIAAGIWFEKRSTAFTTDTPFENHPLLVLPPDKTVEHIELQGVRCEVRSNSKPPADLVMESTYCSQPLFHIALELDGRTSVACRFDVRTRNKSTTTTWRNSLGRVEARVDRVITLSDAKRLIQPYLDEVKERRRKMGK